MKDIFDKASDTFEDFADAFFDKNKKYVDIDDDNKGFETIRNALKLGDLYKEYYDVIDAFPQPSTELEQLRQSEKLKAIRLEIKALENE